jgi:DtxR family Mn-dependent transcriptional regulator
MAKRAAVKRQSASMEDYLEAIGVLSGQGKVVRANQISRALDVKKSSVTAALKKLAATGLVIHEPYGYVELTREGKKVAEGVIRRHRILARFFTEVLDVDEKTAEEDACKIEHMISPVCTERLTEFLEFVEACPLGRIRSPERHTYYSQHEETG